MRKVYWETIVDISKEKFLRRGCVSRFLIDAQPLFRARRPPLLLFISYVTLFSEKK